MKDRLDEAWERITELEHACSSMNQEVCQTLGKVLGYPWFKDDQKNFPGSTEEDGVCVGEHVAETIAAEAAQKIAVLERDLREMTRERDQWKGAAAFVEDKYDALERERDALRAALTLPLLFHAGGPWDDAKRLRWRQITGTDEATTKVMCDSIRALLTPAAPTGGTANG